MMKHYYPAYYDRFRCIAADCPDSCCRGWDVVIDSETEAFYQSLDGAFGKRIRDSIYTDADGDRVFSLKEGKRCPFWGDDKLCEIFKTVGEEHLCKTCAQFPRLSMEFFDFCEHSLALSCPEAARLILSTDDAYAGFTQTDAVGCEDYSADVMNLLLDSRKKCAQLLFSQNPLQTCLNDCLSFAQNVQSKLRQKSTEPLWMEEGALYRLFSSLEYIDDDDRKKLLLACHPADFSGQEKELVRLSLYYLYRYYLGAVDSLDVITPIKIMILSLTMISNFSQDHRITLTEAAQIYSKEIEQSYENMEQIAAFLKKK